MGVISTKHFPFVGDDKFKKKVSCDAKGNFTCNLPAPVVGALGIHEVKGKSIEDVDSAFHKALTDFRSRNTQERKVIIYQVKKTFAAHEGMEIMACASIFTETVVTAGEKKRTTFKEVQYPWDENADGGRGGSSHPFPFELRHNAEHLAWESRSGQVIEHTPEREAFFTRLGQALVAVQGLVSQLHDTEKAIAFADGKLPFLPDNFPLALPLQVVDDRHHTRRRAGK